MDLIIYFSSKTRYFLYYSIMQLFVLLTLCAFTYLSYKSYVTTLEQALTDIFETGSLLFTLLFLKICFLWVRGYGQDAHTS